MNKVILVKAFFKETPSSVTSNTPVSVEEEIDDPWGYKAKEKAKEKAEAKKIHEEKKIDSERLAIDLETALSTLYSSGFQLKEVVTVTSGAYGYAFKDEEITSSATPFTGTESVSGGASYGYGYGYSYTDSLLVIGMK